MHHIVQLYSVYDVNNVVILYRVCTDKYRLRYD